MDAKKLSRRSWLKGVSLGAGGLILEQWLSQSMAFAEGDTSKFPLRIVFIVEDNGLPPDHFVPVGQTRKAINGKNVADTLIETPLADVELPKTIHALTPYRKRMTMLNGLSGCISEGGTGGHSTNYGALGCYPGNRGPMAQTIDSAMADALGGIVRHVTLGVTSGKDTTLSYNISAKGPGKAIPMQCKPELAYKSLFGSVAEGSGKQAFDLKTSLLDFMVDDVKQVQKALPASERVRMESYVDSFAMLHSRQGKIEAIKENLRKNAPKLDDRFVSPTASMPGRA